MRIRARVILADASVLINLSLTDLLRRLPELSEFEFAVPENALAEVTRPEQRRVVDQALEAGALSLVRVEGPASLLRFAEFLEVMGSGESACLTIALEDDTALVASDEQGLFLRTATKLLGPDRIATTPDLIVRLVRVNAISVGEADAAKETLERHRFKMRFASFRDIL